MSERARVSSIDALREFRNSLAVFYDEARQSLGAAQSDVRRAVEWVSGTQMDYWKKEITRRERAVVKAKVDLEQASFAADVGKSTVDERKRLRKCEELLEEAKGKLKATKRWSRELEREALMFRGQLETLSRIVESGEERPMRALDVMSSRLEEYTQIQAAASESSRGEAAREGAGGGGAGGSVSRGRGSGGGGGGGGDAGGRGFGGAEGVPERLLREAVVAVEATLPPVSLSAEDRRAVGGLAKGPPADLSMDLFVEVGVEGAGAVVLRRDSPIDQDDSGWRAVRGDGGGVGEGSSFVRVPLVRAVRDRPMLGDVLRFGRGWRIGLEDGGLAWAVSPDGEERVGRMRGAPGHRD